MSEPSVKKFYPDIYCLDPRKRNAIWYAIEDTRCAIRCGADGVFLAGHSVHQLDLIDIFGYVRKRLPETWIGINFLGLFHTCSSEYLSEVARCCKDLNALLIDGLPAKKLLIPNTTSVYGGITCNYINQSQSDDDLKHMCEQAGKVVDVVTIITKETEPPPDILKLKRMRDHLPPKTLLALINGVNEENVMAIHPFANNFLGALSVTEETLHYDDKRWLIPEKVKKLAHLIHS